MNNFKGVVIEESLKDKDTLFKIHILSTKVETVTEAHKTPWLKQWTLHTAEIPEEQMETVAEDLKKSLEKEHNWYIHFWNENILIIIFKDRIFKFNQDDQSARKIAVEHGVSLGIPEYQLNFPTN